MSRSVLEVDLDAVAHNVSALHELAGGAEMCAVVKADGYGHGAVPVAEAALGAGATWLAVATLDEAATLRAAGIESPLLLLSEPRVAELREVVAMRLRPTLYRELTIDRLAEVVRAIGAAPVPVHLKVDTGMQRVGAHPSGALSLAKRVASRPELVFEGLATHLAVADEPDNDETSAQLDRFDAVLDELAAAGLRPRLVHAANSAGTIGHARSHRDLVRCGISIYGVSPAPGVAPDGLLRPAMRFTSSVGYVKRVEAGSGVSYGLHHHFERDTVVATIPVGYADGVPRALGLGGGEVLVHGRRCPMVGVVTMDQTMVDVGPDATVDVDDEVVLLGSQGGQCILPEEWASICGTIAYEIVCNAGQRAERHWIGPGAH